MYLSTYLSSILANQQILKIARVIRFQIETNRPIFVLKLSILQNVSKFDVFLRIIFAGMGTCFFFIYDAEMHLLNYRFYLICFSNSRESTSWFILTVAPLWCLMSVRFISKHINSHSMLTTKDYKPCLVVERHATFQYDYGAEITASGALWNLTIELLLNSRPIRTEPDNDVK